MGRETVRREKFQKHNREQTKQKGPGHARGWQKQTLCAVDNHSVRMLSGSLPWVGTWKHAWLFWH